MKLFLMLTALAVAVNANNAYECTRDFNFITGVPYSQISLTDSCSNGVCDANPVYGEKNCPKRAVKFCEAQCDAKPGCGGFFFQKHTNGHEICGFFSGDNTMHAPNAHWVKHSHQDVSQVCEVVTPTAQPVAMPAAQPQMVGRVQVRMTLGARLSQSVKESPAFDLAFRTTIAGLAGTVCQDLTRCGPSDVLITHIGTSDISFQLHVADGHLATQVAARIQGQVDGGAFAAALAANGVTDVATLEKLVFGDVEVEPSPVAEPSSTTEEETPEEAKPWYRHRLCVVRGGTIFLVVALLLVAILLAVRRARTDHVIVLAECPAKPEAVVISVDAQKYAKVESGDFADCTVVDETSKNQL